MARKDKKVMPTSNISTGAERIPPTPEEEAAFEAANPVVREDSAAVETVTAENSGPTEQAVEQAAQSEAATEEKVKAKRGRSKGVQPVPLQAFEFACLKAIWDAIPESSAWDEWVDFASVPKDARSFLGNFNSRGLVELDVDADEGNRVKRVRITEKGNVSVNTPKLKEAASPKTVTAKEPKVKEPKAPSAPRGQYSNPNHKITKLVPSNPRREGTQGYYAFELYREGMTYDEYMKSAYDNTIVCSNGTAFDGPKQVHFLWDVQHGFVGVFDATKEVSDPDYWVAKCKTLYTAPGAGASAPAAKASNVTTLTQPKLSKKEVEEQAAAAKAEHDKLKEQLDAEAQAEGEVNDALAQTATS